MKTYKTDCVIDSGLCVSRTPRGVRIVVTRKITVQRKWRGDKTTEFIIRPRDARRLASFIGKLFEREKAEK